MPSPSAPPAVWPAHVERTGDPCELRWVCNHGGLAASPSGWRRPDAKSRLAALVDDGTLAGLRVVEGNLHVRAVDATAWARMAPTVHDAVVADLARDAAWLTTPVDAPAGSAARHADDQPVAVMVLPPTCRGCRHAETSRDHGLRCTSLSSGSTPSSR